MPVVYSAFVSVITIGVRKITKNAICHSERSEESYKIDRYTADGTKLGRRTRFFAASQNDKLNLPNTYGVITNKGEIKTKDIMLLPISGDIME